MCLTVRELTDHLSKYPGDMKVKLETNKRNDIMSPLVAMWDEFDDSFDGSPAYVVLSYS